MIFDIHGNLYHESWYPRIFNDSVVADFVNRQAALGRQITAERARSTLGVLMADPDGTKTLRLMDKVGIDRKAIMIMDWGLALGEAPKDIERINEEILGVCARYPDRLYGFVGVDPRRPNALDIVERGFEELGARGLKLHPTTGWQLGNEPTDRVVDAAVRRSAPVLVHIGKTIPELNEEHAQPAPLVALARRFTGGTFIAGHSGYRKWREFAAGLRVPDNLLFEVSGWQELQQNNDAAFRKELLGLLEAFPNRVLFGTDGPFYSFNLPASESNWLSLLRRCTEDTATSIDWDGASLVRRLASLQ